MKLGYFAPMPPAETGVADYAASLLRGLQAHFEIALNEDGDLNLYHLGNNQLHREIYLRSLAKPGAVVLHDAVLHHFMLGALTREQYVDEFIYNYGEWHRQLAEDLWQERGRSGSDQRYFEYPMLRRMAETARMVIVHNSAAAKLVRSHVNGARVAEIPHLFEMPAAPAGYDVIRYRESLGIRGHECLFAIFGHLRESKRVLPVMRAFEKLRWQRDDVYLLLAGPFASDDLERAVAPLLSRPGVLRAGYVPESQFWLQAYATDAAINLRYPAAGESSGITTRLMGIGKPVLVTEAEEIAALPAETCVRVVHHATEEKQLFDYMAWLAANRPARAAIGQAAAAYIEKTQSLTTVSNQFRTVLLSL